MVWTFFLIFFFFFFGGGGGGGVADCMNKWRDWIHVAMYDLSQKTYITVHVTEGTLHVIPS